MFTAYLIYIYTRVKYLNVKAELMAEFITFDQHRKHGIVLHIIETFRTFLKTENSFE